MSVVDSLLKEYDGLRAKVLTSVHRDGFTRQDIEDMAHDVVVLVLEESIEPTLYDDAIERVIVNWRRARTRRKIRGV